MLRAVETPRTREELINSALPDETILFLISKLVERVEAYGDVQAARLLFEFRYGKSPEPPSEGTSLEQLMASAPGEMVASSE